MIYKQNNLIIAQADGVLTRSAKIGENAYTAGWNLNDFTAKQLTDSGITKEEITVTAPTLDQVYQNKIQEISQERTAASNGTFTHDGKTFSANTLAKESILSTHGEVLATNAMPTGWIGAWLDASGVPYVIATVAQWKAFYNSYYNTGLALAGKAAQLQGQTTAIYKDANKDEATKINEINAITW